jgi:hypothetical protein
MWTRACLAHRSRGPEDEMFRLLPACDRTPVLRERLRPELAQWIRGRLHYLVVGATFGGEDVTSGFCP